MFVAFLLTLTPLSPLSADEAHLRLEEDVAPFLATALQVRGTEYGEPSSPRAEQSIRTIALIERKPPQYLLRVTLVGASVQHTLSIILNILAAQSVFDFDGHSWELISMDLTHPVWAGISTWGDLLASQERFLRLRFVTPLVLLRNAKDRCDGLLFPQPQYLFSGLLRQWNTLGGPPLLDENELLPRQGGCLVSDYALRLETWKRFDQALLGWCGWIVYDSHHQSTAHRAAFDALARLASFTGIGCHTQWGMGVTLVIPSRKERPR